MTVQSTETKVKYSANGSTVDFDFDFKADDKEDIYVTLVAADNTETEYTNYTVTLNVAAGGTVTTGDTLDNTDILIYRKTAITQNTDYEEGGSFPAEAHENALDKQTLINQEQQEQIDRSLKSGIGSSNPYVLGQLENQRFLELDADGKTIRAANVGSENLMETQPASAENDVVIYSQTGNSKLSGVNIDDLVAGVAPTPTKEEVSLSAGQTVVTLTSPILSFYRVFLTGSSVDGSDLVVNVGFVKDSDTQITLTESYPANTLLTVEQNAYLGGPSSPTGSIDGRQFKSFADAESSIGLIEGAEYTIIDVGAKVVVLPLGSTQLAGDKLNQSGQVLQLQPAMDGTWSVLWFGADPTQGDQYLTFDLAAQRALQAMSVSAGGTNTRGPVRVPAQNWTLGQQVPTAAIWYLDPGAEFTQPTNYLPSNTDNLEYLKGEVIKIGARGFNVLQVGDPDLDWLANNWRASAMGTSAIFAASSQGAVGLTVCSRSSDNPSGGEGTIGVQSYVANDNETNLGNTYNYFGATYRSPGAGTTFNTETNVTTIGTMQPFFPYGDYGGTYGGTANHWVGGPEGGTVGGYEDVDKRPTSAGIVFSPGLAINPANGKKWGFDAGMVFLKVAFENGSQDIIRSFTGSRFQYWRDGGGDSVVRLIGNEDESSAGSGKYELQVRDVSDGSLVNYRFYRDKLITTDNKADLGIASNRWITGYFYNAPDIVSDRTEKYDETEFAENEINCFIEVGKLCKKWKWIRERDKKEEGETVYWHVGQIAQDLWNKMEEYGLDPNEWGLINLNAETGKYSVCKEEINSLVNAAIIAKVGL